MSTTHSTEGYQQPFPFFTPTRIFSHENLRNRKWHAISHPLQNPNIRNTHCTCLMIQKG